MLLGRMVCVSLQQPSALLMEAPNLEDCLCSLPQLADVGIILPVVLRVPMLKRFFFNKRTSV